MRKTKKQKAQVTLAFSTTEFDYNIASPAVRFPVLIGPQLGCSAWLAAEFYGIVTKGTTQLLSITQATGTEWKGAHQCGPLMDVILHANAFSFPGSCHTLCIQPGWFILPARVKTHSSTSRARAVNAIILSFTMYCTEITRFHQQAYVEADIIEHVTQKNNKKTNKKTHF